MTSGDRSNVPCIDRSGSRMLTPFGRGGVCRWDRFMRLRGIDLVRSPSVRIAGLYFGYAASWIVLTDRLIAGHQTLKGVGFVLASAMVIGVLMHRAWEARERTERRFQAVVENAAEIITIIDGEGRRLYHSPAIERVRGYKADDRSEERRVGTARG